MADNKVRIVATVEDKVSGTLGKIRDKFDTLGKGAASASLAGNLGAKAIAKGFGIVDQAAGAVVGAISDSIAAASDLNETMSKSAVVFGSSADIIDKWGDTTASSLGLSKNAAIGAAATFGNLFNQIGVAKPQVAEMSTNLVKLAGDLASFNNIDPTEALEKLRSGLAGESEPLRSVGVFLTEAKVKTKALQLGFKEVNGTLSESAKIQARYALILEETTSAQGDFARTSEGVANQQRILQARLDNTSAEFGQKLIPLTIAAQKAFIGLFDVIEGHSGQIAEIGSSITEEVAGGTLDGLKKSKAALEKGISDLSIFGGFASGQRNALAEQLKVVDAAITNFAEHSADVSEKEMQRLRDAFGGGGMAAAQAFQAVTKASSDMARNVHVDAVATAKFFDDSMKAMIDSAEDAINDAYDPQIEKLELLATEAEASALRRKVAAGKATTADKQALLEADKAIAEHLLNLATAGQTTSNAYKTGIANLKTAIKNAKGPAKAALQEVLDKILAVEKAGKTIPINIKVSTNAPALLNALNQFWAGKAEGGPVKAGQPYIVGEKGPELFTPGQSGNITPNNQLAVATHTAIGGGGGRGLTVHFNSVWPPTPMQAREIARLIDREHGYTMDRAVPSVTR